MLVTPKGELIASSTGLVGSTEQGRSARPDHEYKRKAREEDDGNERRALPITPFAPAFINIQLKYSAIAIAIAGEVRMAGFRSRSILPAQVAN